MIAESRSADSLREAAVERRWPHHRWDAAGRSRWAGWGWRPYHHIAICGLLIGGDLLLEEVVWRGGEGGLWWPFGLLSDGAPGLTLLALLLLANGWLVDRALADRTPGDLHVPGWLRWLRGAAVTLPVVGLAAIPAWRWWIQERPTWALRPATLPPLRLSAAGGTMAGPAARLGGRLHALRRRLAQSLPALLFWLIAGQIAPGIALLSWLRTSPALGPEHPRTLVALAILAHCLAGALGLHHGAIRRNQLRAGRLSALALRCAPLTFLLPFPVWLVGISLWAAVAGEDAQTLVGLSHASKLRPPAPLLRRSGSAVRRLLRFLREGKREVDVVLNAIVPGALEISTIAAHRLAFFRLKTFALLLDAALVAWVSVKLGGPAIDFDSSWTRLLPFLLLAVSGLLLEAIFLILRLIGWLHRGVPPYQPYGRCLVSTQLALASGLLLGALVAEGQASSTGLLLQAIGLGAAIATTLLAGSTSVLFLLPGRRILSSLAWAGLFFELFVSGVVIENHSELAPPFLELLRDAILLSPVWSGALFLGAQGWLLHPLDLGHLADRRLTVGARAALAFVVLTGALPLGGIAIPFWIYAHHRLWPSYEKLQWARSGTRPP